MKIEIANPIYDPVFKRLMQRHKFAKYIISKIIGAQVITLEAKSQEKTAAKNKSSGKSKTTSIQEMLHLSIFRLDYSAKIGTPEGERSVLIEMQKVNLFNDIMRFRHYLGSQYQDEVAYEIEYLSERRSRKVGLPIISIYILGDSLPTLAEYPVLQVLPTVIDHHTGKSITHKESFIASLHHKSIIISLAALPAIYRNPLERFFGIFDQRFKKSETPHILEIDADALALDSAEREIVQELHKIVQDPKIRKEMEQVDYAVEEYSRIQELADERLRLYKEEQKKRLQEQFLREEEQRKREEEQRKREEAQEREFLRQTQFAAFLIEVQKISDLQLIASITGLDIEKVQEIANNIGN
jgi:hypothetical protein